MVSQFLQFRKHPEQSYRICLGLLSLAKKYSPERLSLLLAQEITGREQRKIQRLIRQTKFRMGAEIEQINYQAERQIKKLQIRSLAQGEWLRLRLRLRLHQNMLITGATGCGKNYLACALGHHHCRQGKTVFFYFRLKELLELIDTRYDSKSILIASQLPVKNWFEMMGESTHADAILD